MSAAELFKSDRFNQALFLIAGVLGSAVLAWLIAQGSGRMAIAGGFLVVLIAVMSVSPKSAVLGVMIFLPFLGDIRRLLISLVGWSGEDPILLIAPVVAGLMVVFLLASKRITFDTKLSKLIGVLMIVMCLQMLNPKQGNLQVGVAGALFYLAPLLWFWVGREFINEAAMRKLLLYIVLPIAMLACLMGLAQVYVGFTEYQLNWVDTAGYAALWLTRDIIRPFSFFVSSSEYASYLMIANAIILALLWKRNIAAAILLPVTVWALFVLGSRGPLLKTVVLLAVTWAVMGKTMKQWIPRGLIALTVGIFALFYGLTQLQTMDLGDGGAAVKRQAEGFLEADDREKSTAGVHGAMFVNGFVRGFQNPLGFGLGATTRAANKFGGKRMSSEVDLSNLFISLGAIGGIIYLIIIILVMKTAIQAWIRHRTWVWLAILGMLTVAMGGWLNGGMYSIVALAWVTIGFLDKTMNTDPVATA